MVNRTIAASREGGSNGQCLIASADSLLFDPIIIQPCSIGATSFQRKWAQSRQPDKGYYSAWRSTKKGQVFVPVARGEVSIRRGDALTLAGACPLTDPKVFPLFTGGFK
jgi:hypothetical protein